MKKLISVSVILFLVLCGSAFAEETGLISVPPNLKDYVFKYENNTLYWSDEADCKIVKFDCCEPNQENVTYYEINKDMPGFYCWRCSWRECTWRDEIPGTLLRELLK